MPSAAEAPAEPPTRQLAAWVAAVREGDLPADAIHAAKRCLIDHVAVAVAARDDPSTCMWVDHLRELGGTPQASLYGRPETARVNVVQAAQANAYAAHVLDYDDTLATTRTTLHGSAPVWPAALAIAEWRRLAGREALAAFVLGYDVAWRVAEAAGPSHYHTGWHVTGTTGRFGAAAAAGKLLGLPADQLTHAFGIAGTQAGGLKAVYGSMCKALHPARAAGDGVAAALLAARGFTSSGAILEAKYGFLEILSQAPSPERLTAGLGHTFNVTRDGFKPYACGSLMHALIDGVLELRNTHGLDPSQVERIQVWAHPYVLSVTGKREPCTGLEGKFSAYHAAAVALIDGGAQVAQFTDARVQDARVRSLRDRVALHAREGFVKDQAVVQITLQDGAVLEADIPHASGTPDRPLTDARLDAKARGLLEPVLGAGTTARVLDLAWHFDEVPDAGAFLRTLGAHS